MMCVDPPPKRIAHMLALELTRLNDSVLLQKLAALVAHDRSTTATLLAYIAEVDERRLYAPAGYPSMYAYCVEALHLSEDAAAKRIHVARSARAFPVLLDALADGRLHMTAVRLLAPYLTPGNVGALIAEATHRSRAEVEQLLARRFPRAEALRLDDGISALPNSPSSQVGPIPGQAFGYAPGHTEPADVQHAPGHTRTPQTVVAPLSPERYVLQIAISRTTHDKLRFAQSLLGHAIPSGDVACVLDRALDSLIGQIEKRKLGATKQSRRQPRPTRGRRHVPAAVRRGVWERDQGRCTFVGDSGHRCDARTQLEFDHIDPVARGGQATVERMRLRCRAHNQLEAERAFGVEFMRRKRAATGRPAGAASDRPIAEADSDDQAADVIAGLRALGLRAIEARHLAGASRPDHPASLEERLRLALRAHQPRGTVRTGVRAPAPAGGQPGGEWNQAPAGP